MVGTIQEIQELQENMRKKRKEKRKRKIRKKKIEPAVLKAFIPVLKVYSSEKKRNEI